MSAGNGNGNGDEPDMDERLNPHTADLSDPAILRRYLIESGEAARAAIEGGTRMAVSLEQHRAETKAQHAAVMGLLNNIVCPRLEGLDKYTRLALDDLAATLAEHGIAFDTALKLEAMAREEGDEAIRGEVVKVNERVAENREAINEMSGPDVPDLAEVTGVRDIHALVSARLTEHALEVTRGKLSEAHEAEKARVTKAEASAKAWRDRIWAVVLLVLGAVVARGLPALVDWLK